MVDARVAFMPGIGLYSLDWLEQLKKSFIAWMLTARRATLSEVLREMRARWPVLSACEDATLEALLDLWPEVQVRRDSIFEAQVELVVDGLADAQEPDEEEGSRADCEKACARKARGCKEACRVRAGGDAGRSVGMKFSWRVARSQLATRHKTLFSGPCAEPYWQRIRQEMAGAMTMPTAWLIVASLIWSWFAIICQLPSGRLNVVATLLGL